MKKTLTLILVVLILTLTGCGKTDNTSSDIDTSSNEIISSNDVNSKTETSSDEVSSVTSSEMTSSGTSKPSKTETISSNISSTNKTESNNQTSSNVSPQAPAVWEYKNGGDDYIIKTDGKKTIKIPVDISRHEFPENTATETYEISITRNAVQKINNWIYFFEVYKLHCSWESDNPDFDGAGSYTTTTRGLYRIKEDGSSLEQITETTNITEEGTPHPTCYFVLGFDGADMYFIKNRGYEPAGDICKITITDNIEYFVDKATVFDWRTMIPQSSYIDDGKIYLFGLDTEPDSAVISISDLKVK